MNHFLGIPQNFRDIFYLLSWVHLPIVNKMLTNKFMNVYYLGKEGHGFKNCGKSENNFNMTQKVISVWEILEKENDSDIPFFSLSW